MEMLIWVTCLALKTLLLDLGIHLDLVGLVLESKV
jgi:hypothetical protein